MAKDYEPAHDYHEPQAESKILDERFVGRSRRTLRFFRYLLLCVLVLILALTVIINRESINMDNLRRLFAKIDIGISSREDVDGQQIEFAFEADATVTSFKDGLAYLTPSGLTIMDNLGTVFMSTQTGYATPELITTDRYTVAYDRGGTGLLVTNSFAVVFEKNMPEKISYATMGKENFLCVITTGGGYKNSLYVYNDSFEEIFVWHSNERYLLNGAISPDGKTVVLSCYNVKDGAAKAELVGIHLDEEEIAWSAPLEHLPLDVSYKNNHLICLLFDDHLDFYDHKGEKGKGYLFEKNFLQSFVLDEDHTLLVLSSGKLGQSTLYEINNRGKVASEFSPGAQVTSLDVKGNQVALLTDTQTFVYSLLSEKAIYQKPTNNNVQAVAFGGKNCLLDIYSTYCVYNEIK